MSVGVTGWNVVTSATDAVTTFELEFPGVPTYCTRVQVTKTVLTETTADTEIISRGYNTSCGNILSDTIVVERAIRVTY